MFQIDILEWFGSYDVKTGVMAAQNSALPTKEHIIKLKSTRITKHYFNLLAALIFLRCKWCLLGLTKQNPSLSLYILEPA